MLTNEDLEKMRRIIREEVENEVENAKDDLNMQIITSRMRLTEEVEELKSRIKNFEIRMRKWNNEDIDDEEEV